MACPKCIINPDSHSFTPFGTHQGSKLIFTSPARALDVKETEEKIVNIKKHLDTVKECSWIWVFDFGHMQMKHYSSLRYILKLAEILNKEHDTSLKEIWVLRPNQWLQTMLTISKGLINLKLLQKLTIFDGKTLDLYLNLQKFGLQDKPLHWLGQVITMSPETPLPPISYM